MDKKTTPIISEIIMQHAEEAAFLWVLRDRGACAPHYSLSDLAKLDDRIEAHIDGLRIAGEAGWEICKEALSLEEPGEVFAASVLAFGSGDEGRIETVVNAGTKSPELSRGLISALSWLPHQQTEGHIKKLLSSDAPMARRVGIAAAANHGQDPGETLIHALTDGNFLLKARALKAVGQLGRVDLAPFLHKNMKSEDEMCRFYAAWSASLLGDESAIPILKSFVESVPPPHPNPLPQGERERTEDALEIALRRMGHSAAKDWQRELAQNPDSVRLSVTGAGAIGDPDLIPWLIEQMKIAELARVAGESFTMITGVDIAYEDLEGKGPEGFEAGPTENPEDENVEMDPDEDLPWPDPVLIQKWWDQNKGRFRDGTRYLLGQPLSPEHLQQVLKTGLQRQRAAAATELAMTNPGQPLFEVRAPGFRQKKILGLN
jgi:uncharacterized protein (TIGR02270 family)